MESVSEAVLKEVKPTKEELDGTILLREMQTGDRNLILSTWLKGLYFGSDYFRTIDASDFFEHYNRLFNAYLDSHFSSVTIAALRNDPDVIVGYSIADEDTLHFVFVKKAWRKKGIGRMLVPVMPKVITFLTKVGKSLKPDSVKFKPFLF